MKLRLAFRSPPPAQTGVEGGGRAYFRQQCTPDQRARVKEVTNL
jgi:hypothetical protein